MKKWVLGLCGALLLGCGGAKNAGYVKDPSNYTLQNESADKKLRVLREQCRTEKVEACGVLIDKGDTQGLQTLCDSQVGGACYYAGYYFYSNSDMSEAKTYFRKACELGNKFACGVANGIH